MNKILKIFNVLVIILMITILNIDISNIVLNISIPLKTADLPINMDIDTSYKSNHIFVETKFNNQNKVEKCKEYIKINIFKEVKYKTMKIILIAKNNIPPNCNFKLLIFDPYGNMIKILILKFFPIIIIVFISLYIIFFFIRKKNK